MLTNGYNDAMKRILPLYGIELVEIVRQQADHEVISASRVRELLGRRDRSSLGKQVPASTLAYLEGEASAPIRARLEQDYRS